MIMSDDLIYINLKSLKDFVRIRNFSPKKEIFILYFVDDLSKICWIEILPDKKPLTIIFATLNAFNNMNLRYKINVHSVLTYKKSEFYLKARRLGLNPTTFHQLFFMFHSLYFHYYSYSRYSLFFLLKLFINSFYAAIFNFVLCSLIFDVGLKPNLHT
jgi:hypothetical protein